MPRVGDPKDIKVGSGLTNQDSVSALSLTQDLIPDDVLKGILQGTGKVLPASKVSTTGSNQKFFTKNAQGNFNEVSFLLPPQPPKVGGSSVISNNTGITDWGILKLNDAGLSERGLISTTNLDGDLYPYYWVAPEIASSFDPSGNDPYTDPIFNVLDGVYTGGGLGQSHAGGFPRFGNVVQTSRVLPPTGGSNPSVILSGTIFPADRGVLALIHWPAGGLVASFLFQPLQQRCVAALLLGQGINGETPTNCDGDPGGIFSSGPGFPGREEGQLDLEEIHTGINAQTGDPLPDGPLPSAGQVRLGTDPNAGPVIPGGIPILGATTIATGGGNDNNFFRYRLPHLSDYSNLWMTPLSERLRYFEKPSISLDPGVNLSQAGAYQNFSVNFATFQLGRYRHRFLMPFSVAAAGLVVEQGNYILVHFKTERNFESFVRDGVLPDDATEDYEIWSASLSNWDNPEDPINLTDMVGYHVLRAATANDPIVIQPSVITATYSYRTLRDEIMWVSGVQYFIPNAASGTGDAWSIDTSNLIIDDLFSNSYLLGESSDPLDITQGLTHRNPMFLYMGGYTTNDQIITPSIPTFSGNAKTQRVEFSYSELGSFDLVTAPISTDQVTISHLASDPSLKVLGNDIRCHFWTDARLRAFGRKPPGHETVANSAIEFLFDRPGGDKILFHTTAHGLNFDAPDAIYGNFTVPPDNNPRSQLENPLKDTQELFLDEVYRVTGNQLTNLDPTWDGVKGNLVGPGLPFVPAAIELPVRFASSSLVEFGFASFLKNLLHLENLSTSGLVNRELQMSGFPDRAPPLSDGVTNPVPFSGILRYPKDDFQVGYRPSLALGDVSSPQPNYSAIVNDRFYYRVLDAAFSNDSNPELEVIGQPFLHFRVDGLKLEDYAFFPPGPGSTKIGIEIKIPGFTTWMDIGRRDGEGPSKQDPLLDGAGCQIVGPETFDGVDSKTGVVFSQIKVHVGPAANVLGTSGTVIGVPINIAPIFVKVTIRKVGDDLDFSQGGPNSSSLTVRGLTGIRILRHGDF